MYVVVRKDIPHPHQTVQATHAAIAATNAYGQPLKTHPHLVICTAESEPALNDLFNQLKEAGVPCAAWTEDDMSNQLTAIATGLLRGQERQPLRNLPLLR